MSELRDRIHEVLRHNSYLSEEQMEMISHAAGGVYGNHTDHPSDYTVLCILALLDHIERLEERVESLEGGKEN